MKAIYRPTERVEFHIEGETPKDIFMGLAQTHEVFGESQCGQCGSTNIHYKVRSSTAKKGKNVGKSFTYYEIACGSCQCYLAVGQHNNDKGTLFPDRKLVDDHGEYVIKDGKKVFDKDYLGWRKPQFRQNMGEDD